MYILHININYLSSALHQTMMESLADVGVESTVFVPVYDEKCKVIIPNSNVIVSRCFEKWDRIFYFLKQRKIQKALIKNIEVSNYELLHAYTLFSDGNIAMRLSKKYGIPYIVAIRGTDMKDFFHVKPYLIPHGIKIMKNAERIIFLSRSYKDIMISKYVSEKQKGEIEKKAVVIPNGIDDFWMKNIYYARNYTEIQKRLSRKELKIICVAQIIKKKNIPFLQKAIQKLVDKGWKVQFNVIGKAIDKGELKVIISNKYTKYLGSKKKEELIECYRNNDIFILVSQIETFGLVYAEAMSQGLPVIYTKGEGFDQQFEDGYVGFPASDQNVDDLLYKILKITMDYRRISENCIKGVQRFDWNQIVGNYKEIYENIIRENGVK